VAGAGGPPAGAHDATRSNGVAKRAMLRTPATSHRIDIATDIPHGGRNPLIFVEIAIGFFAKGVERRPEKAAKRFFGRCAKNRLAFPDSVREGGVR
jgi:hypothetical protein